MAPAADFFSRWSRLKRDAAAAPATPPAPVPDDAVAGSATLGGAAAATAVAGPTPAAPQRDGAGDDDTSAATGADPAPTLDDVARLDHDSSFARFVGRDVEPEVRNAAMRKLFTDPHFNVMDGLDIYIDDYGRPDPLPPGMLRTMVQSQMLGLFTADEEPAPVRPDVAAHADATDAVERADAVPAVACTADDAGAANACNGSLPATAPLAPAPDEDADLQLQPVHDAGRPGPEAGPGPDSGCPH